MTLHNHTEHTSSATLCLDHNEPAPVTVPAAPRPHDEEHQQPRREAAPLPATAAELRINHQTSRRHAMPAATVQPRDYQQRIIAKSLDHFRAQPTASVMVESPTGSGKTVMGLLMAREMQRETGCRVGWVAMRRNLLAQARNENIARGIGLEFQTISMFDRNPPEVDFLVVDEAQHDAAMSMAVLHGQVKPQWILGLTATPYRTDRLRLCFDHVVRDAGIHQLIQDGWLSPYHHYTIPTWSPESVATAYCREPERWGKSLMFFFRSESCQDCADLLRQQDVRCEVVTATSNREQQIDSFLAGRCDVLLSMAILTEGFNCPELKTVFCRPSGQGCTVQMGGRVFRQHPDLPFKQIVQCGETRHPFPRTATPDEQYVWLDGQWLSLKPNQHINAITQRSLAAIAGASVELPAFVASRRKRSDFLQQREFQRGPRFPR